ncbi:MAG: Uma2 family endonuclease, partial [Myxococcales bacterium]|nr:Uma2 family endonuclease [Myxococcales bacterium]
LYYQQIPALSEYVLVAQDRRRVEVWRRVDDQWTYSSHGAGDRAPLPSIGFALEVDELYTAAGVA